MNEYSIVVAHDPGWSEEFKEIGTRIRDALQDAALRIDHIGSTAVPGLDAKPIIDIQLSVRSFEPLASYRDPLQAIGYLHQAGNPELTKRYFREGPGMRRTHIHVREAGSFAEQFALLFRDYLRVHPEEAARYGAEKRQLAYLQKQDRTRYVEAKEPCIWEMMRRASQWSQDTGWRPGKPDA
ncbi:GrpB family protein [Paenibacillus dendritiformis]|uniref:GrpB family protein n=1 Tax=Paenibacillus dendritiformis TaxID=130049 RepID=UPI003653DA57